MANRSAMAIRAVLVMALLAGGLFVALTPKPATAYCAGSASGYAYWWSVGWARETVQYVTTCDGDGHYYGRVTDGAEDGNCVDLYRKDDYSSSWYFTKRSCTVDVWEPFNYYYSDKNAYFKVCKDNSGDCAVQKYNWGF